jgi:hypothetical protein
VEYVHFSTDCLPALSGCNFVPRSLQLHS